MSKRNHKLFESWGVSWLPTREGCLIIIIASSLGPNLSWPLNCCSANISSSTNGCTSWILLKHSWNAWAHLDPFTNVCRSDTPYSCTFSVHSQQLMIISVYNTIFFHSHISITAFPHTWQPFWQIMRMSEEVGHDIHHEVIIDFVMWQVNNY